MTSLRDLPHFDEMVGPDFGADVPASARALFADAELSGLMRLGDDDLVVYGNAELTALAANADAGNVPPGVISEDPVLHRLLSNHIFTMNPPLHAPHRKLFSRHFTARESARYAGIAAAVVDELVAEAAERETIDLGPDFAIPATARFWARVLDMTREEEQAVAEVFATDFSLNFLMQRTPAQDARVVAAAHRYMETISPAIMRSVRDGDNELLTLMAGDLDDVEIDGKPENVGELLGATLADGFHTLAGALANVVHSLVSRPDAHERVRADPGLVEGAFNEGTRLDPPLIMTFRYALADLELDDVRIPAGTLVHMLWMYGNRDPRAFERPDEYDLERGIGRARPFGGGLHICPGRNVSRVLGRAVLTRLTAPDVRVTAVGERTDWVRGSLLHEATALPMSFSRA